MRVKIASFNLEDAIFTVVYREINGQPCFYERKSSVFRMNLVEYIANVYSTAHQ